MRNTSETRTGHDIDQKYITFSLGEEDYGIPVLQALEIVKLDKLIDIPHAYDYFMGLMDIRGSVIPVIDLKKKLGIQLEATDSELERIIIIQGRGKRIGLAVERVANVYQFPPGSIDSGPTTMKGSSNRFITGVGKIKDQFVILLTLDNLFTAEEISGFSKITAG